MLLFFSDRCLASLFLYFNNFLPNKQITRCSAVKWGSSKMCAECQCLSLKRLVGVWSFVRKHMYVLRGVALYLLVSVYDQFWVLNMTWYWSVGVRSSNVCPKRFADMLFEHLDLARPELKNMIAYCYGNPWLLLLAISNARSWSGNVYAVSASPRISTSQLATSPCSAVHGDQFDTQYDIEIYIAGVIRAWHMVGALCLNQPSQPIK